MPEIDIKALVPESMDRAAQTIKNATDWHSVTAAQEGSLFQDIIDALRSLAIHVSGEWLAGFHVDFREVDTLFDPDNFYTTLTVIARLDGKDVTDSLNPATDVVWSRYSEDNKGVERTASDAAWNLRRGNAGIALELTPEDCDFNGYIPKSLKFTATVTLRDEAGDEQAVDAVSFEY